MIISDQTKDCGQIEGHGEQVCGREGQNKIFGGIRCLAKLQDKEDYLTSVWTLFFRVKTAPTQTCDDITSKPLKPTASNNICFSLTVAYSRLADRHVERVRL